MKDAIALWLLVLWLLVTGSKPLFHLIDALQTNRPGQTIFWDAGVSVIAIIVGVFLVRHYVATLDDLRHYKQLEDSRQKDLEARRDDRDSA